MLRRCLSLVSVIETDDVYLVFKMLQDLTQLAEVEVVPIVERDEYVKKMGIEPTSPGT